MIAYETSTSRRRTPHRCVRVVVVEDSRIIRERLGALLADIPNLATVGYATTEDEALTILRQGEWEIVILDLQLKEGTGLRVLEELGKTIRREETTIIVFAISIFRNTAAERSLLERISSSTSRRNSGAFTKCSQAWRDGSTDHRISGLRRSADPVFRVERGSMADPVSGDSFGRFPAL